MVLVGRLAAAAAEWARPFPEPALYLPDIRPLRRVSAARKGTTDQGGLAAPFGI